MAEIQDLIRNNEYASQDLCVAYAKSSVNDGTVSTIDAESSRVLTLVPCTNELPISDYAYILCEQRLCDESITKENLMNGAFLRYQIPNCQKFENILDLKSTNRNEYDIFISHITKAPVNLASVSMIHQDLELYHDSGIKFRPTNSSAQNTDNKFIFTLSSDNKFSSSPPLTDGENKFDIYQATCGYVKFYFFMFTRDENGPTEYVLRDLFCSIFDLSSLFF